MRLTDQSHHALSTGQLGWPSGPNSLQRCSYCAGNLSVWGVGVRGFPGPVEVQQLRACNIHSCKFFNFTVERVRVLTEGSAAVATPQRCPDHQVVAFPSHRPMRPAVGLFLLARQVPLPCLIIKRSFYDVIPLLYSHPWLTR